MRKVALLLALALAPFAFAQTVTIGTLPQTGSIQFSAAPATYVDFTHPAAGTGTISNVTVRWLLSGGGMCANAFKVKFIHTTAGAMSFTAEERGPFNATNG